jgi:hypothetical protein
MARDPDRRREEGAPTVLALRSSIWFLRFIWFVSSTQSKKRKESGWRFARKEFSITPAGEIQKRKIYSLHKLCYTTHTNSDINSHFDIEGGWSFHGSEETSSEEARKEGSEEEVVVIL